jgi:hypothetical protein
MISFRACLCASSCTFSLSFTLTFFKVVPSFSIFSTLSSMNVSPTTNAFIIPLSHCISPPL